MKEYKVSVLDYDYEECEKIYIIAKNEEEAFKILQKKFNDIPEVMGFEFEK